ncbi:META domain-containing protein [Photobacterium damselae]
MKKRLLTVLALPMMLAACASNNVNTPAKPATAAELTGQTWVLTEVDNQVLNMAEPDVAPTLELSKDLGASGHSGCNRYFGQAELKDGQLRIEKMGMTMMACPEPAMFVEGTITEALSNWSTAKVAGDTLTLQSPKHKLTFTRKAENQDAE